MKTKFVRNSDINISPYSTVPIDYVCSTVALNYIGDLDVPQQHKDWVIKREDLYRRQSATPCPYCGVPLTKERINKHGECRGCGYLCG